MTRKRKGKYKHPAWQRHQWTLRKREQRARERACKPGSHKIDPVLVLKNTYIRTSFESKIYEQTNFGAVIIEDKTGDRDQWRPILSSIIVMLAQYALDNMPKSPAKKIIVTRDPKTASLRIVSVNDKLAGSKM
jgi:hypothetical protein